MSQWLRITAVDTLSCTSNEESKLVSNFRDYKGRLTIVVR